MRKIHLLSMTIASFSAACSPANEPAQTPATTSSAQTAATPSTAASSSAAHNEPTAIPDPPASSNPNPPADPKASIGSATMQPNGTIVLMLRAEDGAGAVGDAQLFYAPSHADYQYILKHVGPLKPGESKAVKPFPPKSGN